MNLKSSLCSTLDPATEIAYGLIITNMRSKRYSRPKVKNTAAFRRARKADALALAELIYDIYVEDNAKITNGQNDAQLQTR